MKGDLIEAVHRKCTCPECVSAHKVTGLQIECVINTFIDTIVAKIKSEGKVVVQGLGSFRVRITPPRKGRTPKNPTVTFDIPARKRLQFKISKKLKGELNEGTGGKPNTALPA